MSDVAALIRMDIDWIADALGKSIADLGYPVGCGVAPHPEQMKRAARVIAERHAQYYRMIEERAEAAEARIAALEGALRFYAEPWKYTDCHGDDVRVPDFYSELDFGETAREALAAIDAPAPPGEDDRIQNRQTALLRQCYVTLAFAFKRLHESSRSRDGELCKDFQKARAQIENLFKDIGVKL
jgi:hypothetical protein